MKIEFANLDGTATPIDGSAAMRKALGIDVQGANVIMTDESGKIVAAGNNPVQLERSAGTIKKINRSPFDELVDQVKRL